MVMVSTVSGSGLVLWCSNDDDNNNLHRPILLFHPHACRNLFMHGTAYIKSIVCLQVPSLGSFAPNHLP